MNNKCGFTLIELLVTVALIAILAVIAVPSFTQVIRDNRLTTQTNNLTSALQYARAEAARRGVAVTVTPQGADDDWGEGWIVSVGGASLRVFDGPRNPLTIIGPANLSFGANGVLASGSTQLTVCAESAATGREISLNAAGLIRLNPNYTCP